MCQKKGKFRQVVFYLFIVEKWNTDNTDATDFTDSLSLSNLSFVIAVEEESHQVTLQSVLLIVADTEYNFR